MSEFYASNADSVRDFLQNYTEEQVQGVEDMTDSIANQKDLSWKENADRQTAKAEGQAELGGQLVGGVLGLKGLKAGYGKIKDIYGKYKELKAKGQELKKKLGIDDEDENEVEPDKDDPANVDKDEGDSKIEDNDDPIGEDDTYHTAPFQTGEEDDTETNFTSEVNGENTDLGSTEDITTQDGGGGFSAEDDTIPDINWDDLGNTSIEDFGKWFRGMQSQVNANIETAKVRIGKALGDADEALDKTNSNPVATNDAPVSDRPINLDDLESMSPEDLTNYVTGARQAGTRGVNLDDIFDEPAFQGGQLEGTIEPTLTEPLSQPKNIPRIGDGDVEDIMSRPSADTIQSRTETQVDPEVDEDTVPNAFLDEPKPSIGGSQELDVYKADVPSSYEIPEKVKITGEEGSFLDDAPTGLQDIGGTRSLGSTIVRRPQEFDMDTPEIVERPDFNKEYSEPEAETNVAEPDVPDTIEPPTTGTGEFQNPLFRRPDLDIGEVQLQKDPITESNITADQEGTQSTINASRLPAGQDLQADTSGYGDVVDNAVQGNLENFSKNISTKVSDVGSKLLGGDVEGAAESAGTGLAETLGTEAAEEAGASIAGTVLGAVPVVGEVAGIGIGLYEGIKGLVDLFEKKKSKPPTPKELSGVPQGALEGNNTLLTSKLASGIPTATNDVSFDMSGISSF